MCIHTQVHVGSLDLRANIMIRQIVEVVTDYEKVLRSMLFKMCIYPMNTK